MTGEAHEFLPFAQDRWWLDTAVWRGVTNGLPALRWAPILDIDEPLVVSLLAALAANGIPGRAEPRANICRVPTRQWRVWVDAVSLARAEDILRAELTAY